MDPGQRHIYLHIEDQTCEAYQETEIGAPSNAHAMSKTVSITIIVLMSISQIG